MSKTVDTLTMPAGQYWVGDLCYVLRDQWQEVCEILAGGVNGVHTLEDGTQFACFSTAWGDGIYEDGSCNDYAVDAGIIGCVLAGKVNHGGAWGHVHTFRRPFPVGRTGGVIRFGRIAIDTDPEDA
jgi:hypothetical protein